MGQQFVSLTDPVGTARGGKDGRVYADQLARGIEQRPARVARIDGCRKDRGGGVLRSMAAEAERERRTGRRCPCLPPPPCQVVSPASVWITPSIGLLRVGKRETLGERTDRCLPEPEERRRRVATQSSSTPADWLLPDCLPPPAA